MTTTHSFGVAPITTHSWNGEGDMIAMSHNNKEVQIYKKSNNGYSSTSTLEQHDLRVTGISWASKSNRIVTCSADRNAYVWSLDPDTGKWKHTLVFLRINRAATCVKWSPDENKFAVGSGARLINICYFEECNDWWVAKHIKKPIKSTVTALDWHPNNVLLAAGSTDFKVRVFSAYVKDIEGKPTMTPWGAKMSLNTLMAEFSNSLNGGGWVHDVSFSSDGNKLAWIGHDSSVSVADAKKGMAIYKLKTSALPLLSCVWISDNSFVAAGHDCVPLLFNVDSGGQVSLVSKMESDKKAESNVVFSAKALFKNKDRTGQSDLADTVLNTTHQKQISCIRIRKGDKSNAETISTTAGDGKLVIWDIEACKKALKI